MYGICLRIGVPLRAWLARLVLNETCIDVGAPISRVKKLAYVKAICTAPATTAARAGKFREAECIRGICTSDVLLKVKNKGQKKAQHVDERELGEVFDVDKLAADFRYPVESLKKSLARQVSLRSTVGALEELSVSYDGREYQLQELVQINRKPKLVILNADAHPQTIPAIINTLRTSRLNLNPQQEKTTIYIPIPKITKEYREKLAKSAKVFFHQCRDKLGEVQTSYVKKLKNQNLSIPTNQRIQEYLDIIRHQHIDEAQQLLEAKEKELLGGSD